MIKIALTITTTTYFSTDITARTRIDSVQRRKVQSFLPFSGSQWNLKCNQSLTFLHVLPHQIFGEVELVMVAHRDLHALFLAHRILDQ